MKRYRRTSRNCEVILTPDIAELRDFYQTSAGRHVQALLRRAVAAAWPHPVGGQRVILGYGVPLLPLADAATALLMPATMGAMPCAAGLDSAVSSTALVDPSALPLPDTSVDAAIVLHLIEGLADPAAALRELWRVMKGSGRVLIVVPNRRGLWAQGDGTPLGQGQPYSPSQLRALLKQEGFLIDRVRQTLYAPPGIDRYGLSVAARLERYGGVLLPRFGGLLLAEAGKRIYAPGTMRTVPRRRLVLSVPAIQPLH